MLGCKTPGGFLFVMFDFIIPILEQLELGYLKDSNAAAHSVDTGIS